MTAFRNLVYNVGFLVYFIVFFIFLKICVNIFIGSENLKFIFFLMRLIGLTMRVGFAYKVIYWIFSTH